MSKWIVKMKARPTNSPMSDEELAVYMNEFKRKFEQEKAQKDYYSYAHVVFDNPLLSEDEHDKIWARLPTPKIIRKHFR